MSTWTPPEESDGEKEHPRLLPELIDLVLSFLNPADYTLVSKDWLDPGRKHLFKRIGLHIDYSQKKLVHFTHFLVEAPHISHYIRLLVLLQGTGCKVSVNKLSTLLRYLPRLDTLVLHMLCITSTPDIRPRDHDMVSSFHLKELKLILIWFEESFITSSPLYDLFNIFSSIQTLTLQDCESGLGNFHIPPNKKRVAISRINYSPGEDADEDEDDRDSDDDDDDSDDSDDSGSSGEEDKHDNLKPLSILLRDYIDLSSVKTVGAHLITFSHLAYVVRLIDESFQSADSHLISSLYSPLYRTYQADRRLLWKTSRTIFLSLMP
ncbi:hypothetical protein QCA50_002437 [Cerrena zonata]|uniref:F-box domain-containing protein n=1 Tax=Cerrena zonata TaxID=2478898 RepID=A0AAW0GY00_9APHY